MSGHTAGNVIGILSMKKGNALDAMIEKAGNSYSVFSAGFLDFIRKCQPIISASTARLSELRR